jgi:hypothetical protein
MDEIDYSGKPRVPAAPGDPGAKVRDQVVYSRYFIMVDLYLSRTKNKKKIRKRKGVLEAEQ